MTYKGSSSVERRYAEALAELTIQYAMTEEAIVQLNDVVKLIDHHSELKRTLYDEYLSFQVKKNIIEEVFKDKVSDVIRITSYNVCYTKLLRYKYKYKKIKH